VQVISAYRAYSCYFFIV